VAGSGCALGCQRAMHETKKGFGPWPQETKKNVFLFANSLLNSNCIDSNSNLNTAHVLCAKQTENTHQYKGKIMQWHECIKHNYLFK
jgi:hypothetical protein